MDKANQPTGLGPWVKARSKAPKRTSQAVRQSWRDGSWDTSPAPKRAKPRNRKAQDATLHNIDALKRRMVKMAGRVVKLEMEVEHAYGAVNDSLTRLAQVETAIGIIARHCGLPDVAKAMNRG